MTMQPYSPPDHPLGGPRPPADGVDVPDTIDPVEARRIQDAIDRADADFKKLESSTSGLRRV